MRKSATVKGHEVVVMYLGEFKTKDINFDDKAKAKAAKLWKTDLPKGMEINGLAKMNGLEAAIIKHETEGKDLGGLLLGFEGRFFAALSLS